MVKSEQVKPFFYAGCLLSASVVMSSAYADDYSYEENVSTSVYSSKSVQVEPTQQSTVKKPIQNGIKGLSLGNKSASDVESGALIKPLANLKVPGKSNLATEQTAAAIKPAGLSLKLNGLSKPAVSQDTTSETTTPKLGLSALAGSTLLNSSEGEPLASPESVAPAEEPSMFAFLDDWFGIEEVKPWQKGTLAQQEMKPGGAVPEFELFTNKVLAYKQGARGGSGVGGGGCGCN